MLTSIFIVFLPEPRMRDPSDPIRAPRADLGSVLGFSCNSHVMDRLAHRVATRWIAASPGSDKAGWLTRFYETVLQAKLKEFMAIEDGTPYPEDEIERDRQEIEAVRRGARDAGTTDEELEEADRRAETEAFGDNS